MLLRACDEAEAEVEHVDWDQLKVRVEDSKGRFRVVRVPLTNPLGLTRQEMEGLFRPGVGLEALLLGLGAGLRECEDEAGGREGSRAIVLPSHYTQ